ncbi:MAG: hypothetical protein M1827_002217 [Pycnora praestabilis]|nr:MAG: hypothetical protein M1827_002217 [Pycnora praestabilis]
MPHSPYYSYCLAHVPHNAQRSPPTSLPPNTLRGHTSQPLKDANINAAIVPRGLSVGNIIKTPPHTKRADPKIGTRAISPPSPPRHHTTRASVEGKKDTDYDMKHHPMNDVLRPSQAGKRHVTDDLLPHFPSPKRRRSIRGSAVEKPKVNYDMKHHPMDDGIETPTLKKSANSINSTKTSTQKRSESLSVKDPDNPFSQPIPSDWQEFEAYDRRVYLLQMGSPVKGTALPLKWPQCVDTLIKEKHFTRKQLLAWGGNDAVRSRYNKVRLSLQKSFRAKDEPENRKDLIYSVVEEFDVYDLKGNDQKYVRKEMFVAAESELEGECIMVDMGDNSEYDTSDQSRGIEHREQDRKKSEPRGSPSGPAFAGTSLPRGNREKKDQDEHDLDDMSKSVDDVTMGEDGEPIPIVVSLQQAESGSQEDTRPAEMLARPEKRYIPTMSSRGDDNHSKCDFATQLQAGTRGSQLNQEGAAREEKEDPPRTPKLTANVGLSRKLEHQRRVGVARDSANSQAELMKSDAVRKQSPVHGVGPLQTNLVPGSLPSRHGSLPTFSIMEDSQEKIEIWVRHPESRMLSNAPRTDEQRACDEDFIAQTPDVPTKADRNVPESPEPMQPSKENGGHPELATISSTSAPKTVSARQHIPQPVAANISEAQSVAAPNTTETKVGDRVLVQESVLVGASREESTADTAAILSGVVKIAKPAAMRVRRTKAHIQIFEDKEEDKEETPVSSASVPLPWDDIPKENFEENIVDENEDERLLTGPELTFLLDRVSMSTPVADRRRAERRSAMMVRQPLAEGTEPHSREVNDTVIFNARLSGMQTELHQHTRMVPTAMHQDTVKNDTNIAGTQESHFTSEDSGKSKETNPVQATRGNTNLVTHLLNQNAAASAPNTLQREVNDTSDDDVEEESDAASLGITDSYYDDGSGADE